MIGKNGMKKIILVFLLFIASGFIHIALSDCDYAICIMQLIYGSCVIIWAVNIEQRIIDNRVRSLLLFTAAFMLLYVVLQMCKYSLFIADGLLPRYLWYAYYIPMTGVPLTLYFIAIYMNLSDDEKPEPIYFLPIIPAVLIVLGFMTNELHYLAFSFPPGALADDGSRKLGIISLVFWVYVSLLLIFSLVVILKKCRLNMARRWVWLPLLPVFFGASLFVIDALGLSIKINDTSFLNIGEIFGFMAIGFVEICVQIGIIPSNREYEKLFSITSAPAVIKDMAGRCIYNSKGAEQMPEAGENVQIKTSSICGGSVSWAVDISQINLLNRKLTDLTEQIEARNEYLKTQNSLKEEQSAIAARSRVYDQITEIIKPQLSAIDSLVRDEDNFSKNLSRIAVYNAYIKRRSNLELIKEKSETISVTELVTAVRESVEYLTLYGVETASSVFTQGDFDAQGIIIAYEFFEYVVETALLSLKQMSVVLAAKNQRLSLRMILNMDKDERDGVALDLKWRSEDIKKYGARIEITDDKSDKIVVFIMEKDKPDDGNTDGIIKGMEESGGKADD